MNQRCIKQLFVIEEKRKRIRYQKQNKKCNRHKLLTSKAMDTMRITSLLMSFLLIHCMIMKSEVFALHCHQCTSKDSRDCTTSRPNALKICPKNEKYCVKIEEYTKNNTKVESIFSAWGSGGTKSKIEHIHEKETMISLIRTCMKENLGSYCSDSITTNSNKHISGGRTAQQMEGQQEKVTICHAFCEEDGCNSANNNNMLSTVIFQTIGMMISLIYLCTIYIQTTALDRSVWPNDVSKLFNI